MTECREEQDWRSEACNRRMPETAYSWRVEEETDSRLECPAMDRQILQPAQVRERTRPKEIDRVAFPAATQQASPHSSIRKTRGSRCARPRAGPKPVPNAV